MDSIHGDKGNHAGDEKILSPSSATSPSDDGKSLSYHMRGDCWGLRVGCIFDDWYAMGHSLVTLDGKLFANVQRKKIVHPEFDFNKHETVDTLSKHRIVRNSFHATNLTLDECCLDDELLMLILREQQATIAAAIRKSPKKRVVFVYGTAHAGKLEGDEYYFTRLVRRFNTMRKYFQHEGEHSSASKQIRTSIRSDMIIAVAVLELTIEKGGLQAEKLSREAHF